VAPAREPVVAPEPKAPASDLILVIVLALGGLLAVGAGLAIRGRGRRAAAA
jgi:hypothetical protein